jgi:predicted GTPase
MSFLRRHWRESVLLLCLLGPLASLLGFGMFWLAGHGALLPWLGFAAAAALGAALLLRVLRAGEAVAMLPAPAPDAGWGPRERSAWEVVQARIARTPPWLFDTLAEPQTALTELVEEVARHYGPDSVEPLARFTVPEALLLAERTARRLRADLLSAVPFVHAVPLSTCLWWYRRRDLLDLATRAYDVYRVFRPLLDPVSALLGEVRGRVTHEVMEYGADRLRRTLTRLLLEEAGRAAIDLYSGRLRIDEARLEAAPARPATAPQPGPPRVLLAGQVNAGKSSLANALAGEVRAAATPLPGPAAETVLEIAVAGHPALFLVDSPGLRGEAGEGAALAALAGPVDLVLWVCAANAGAREPDRLALAALRRAQDQATDPPPVLLVVAHVDRLSPFAEWAPPYDLVRPGGQKAANIRDAIDTIGAELGIAREDAVPVCLDPRRGVYNIDLVWALIAARLPQARMRQIQRAYAEARQGLDLAAVLRQARSAGRALFGALR